MGTARYVQTLTNRTGHAVLYELKPAWNNNKHVVVESCDCDEWPFQHTIMFAEDNYDCILGQRPLNSHVDFLGDLGYALRDRAV